MAGYKTPLVSIIIVTFNSQKYIKQCLEAVLETDYKKFEIIVVDNGSEDETINIVAKGFLAVKLIKSPVNSGYAGGNNLGVARAGGDLIAIINPDTLVTENWLKPLVRALENEKVAACQPKILLLKDRNSINALGKTVHYLGFDWPSDYLVEDHEGRVREIVSFSGSAVLIKKEIFQKLDGFDSSFFMYFEDGDLSWRMRLLGYKLLVVPESIVYHDYKYQPEENYQRIRQKFYFLERNRLVNLIKNYSSRSLLLLLPVFVVTEVGMNLYFLSNGWYLEKFRGYVWILSNLLEILKKRKLVQANRKIADNEITKDFVSRIDFSEFNNSLLKYFANPFFSSYWFLARLLTSPRGNPAGYPRGVLMFGRGIREKFGIINEGVRRILYLIPDHPKVAQIEITNRCNFKCKMCQRNDLRVVIKDMDWDLYKQIIDKLKNVKEVILAGWGEPLLHPQLIEMIEYAKKEGKKVSLTSNGSLLSKELTFELIDSGLDSISFSVDEITVHVNDTFGHPITNQVEKIENFMKYITHSKTKLEVTIQTTLHKDWEKKFKGVIEWSSKVGADLVNINRLDIRFNPLLSRPSFFEEKEVVDIINKLSDIYNIRIDFRPYVAFTGLFRQFYNILIPLMHRRGKHCLRVYDYIYVNNKAEVTPCCALPLYSSGNILEDSLENIWKSKNFQLFRQHDFQRKICGKCDVLELKQYV